MPSASTAPASSSAAVSAESRRRRIAAGAYLALATLLLTWVIAVLAVSGDSVARGATRVAYVSGYLLAAVATLGAARAARHAPGGSALDRRRRALGWHALTAYALVVPTAILLQLGFTRLGVGSAGRVAADLVAFLAYPAAVAALFAFTRPRPDLSRATRVLDLAIVVTATLSVAGFVYLRRTAAGLFTDVPVNFVYFVLSPMGTLAILLTGTWLMLDHRGRTLDPALSVVLAAISTSTLADLVRWIPGVTVPGLNPGLWGTAMWLVTAAAVIEVLSPAVPTPEPEDVRRVRGYSFLPSLAASSAAGILLVSANSLSDDAIRFLVQGLVLVAALVIGRLLSALRENRRLLVRQREADARFRALVRRSADALLVLTPQGKVTYHSPAIASVFGLDEQGEALGLDVRALVAPEDAGAIEELLASARGAEQGRSGVVRTATNPPRWVELVVADHTSDADIGGLVIAARDVTERRILESRLAQSERLEAVGRLAGGVAHDFNNMLTAILGYADLVEQSATRGRVDLEDVHEIQRAARRSAELTRQLLAFARRQMIAPRLLDPDDVVRGMERMLRRLLGPTVKLRLDLHAAPWCIVADPSQIEQIILNLALNARDAMPDGGLLDVALAHAVVSSPPPASGSGDLESMPPGEYVHLRVRDTGEGIPNEHLGRIFEPFFTTKPEGAGTGLGLSTVYGITKQAQGFVGVDSAPGQGTTFNLYFPRATAEPDPTPAEPMTAVAATA